MRTYKIINRETGTVIESGLDLYRAEYFMHSFEKTDIHDGVFVKDFYQMIEE
jgi:hypothetical protein